MGGGCGQEVIVTYSHCGCARRLTILVDRDISGVEMG